MADLIKNNTWNIAKHEYLAFGTISSADITGTAAGQFGHASGYPLVTVPAGYVAELLGVIAIYDYSTAQYGAGGNVTINETGGSAVTGLISAANSFGAASDKIVRWIPLAAAAANLTAALGWSLVAAAAFTQPGTAAGVIRYIVRYRMWQTNL